MRGGFHRQSSRNNSQRERQQDHSELRGFHRGRRAGRRRRGKGPGHSEPDQHDLRRQAAHWKELRRGDCAGRREALAVQSRRRELEAQNRSGVPRADEDVPPGGGKRHGAVQAEGNGREAPREAGDRRGGDDTGQVQRLATAGDEGRRSHRRPQRPQDRERADGGGHRLRARQDELGGGTSRSGVRSRRRNFRRQRAGDGRRRL